MTNSLTLVRDNEAEAELFVVLGRNYLAKNTELIASLITCLKMEKDDVLTQDHVLGCLQRLSLKSVLSTVLFGHGQC